jgi:hypothetical protein
MRLIRRRAIEIQAIWADRAKAAGAPAMTTAALHLLTVDAAHDRARRLKQIVAATDGPAAAASRSPPHTHPNRSRGNPVAYLTGCSEALPGEPSATSDRADSARSVRSRAKYRVTLGD